MSQAKVNQLDDQDNQTVHKLVKKLADKLFLLETTQYNSKKLQKELLSIMPDKIAAESEYEPISKKEYIDSSIRLAIKHKDRINKIIRNKILHYLETNHYPYFIDKSNSDEKYERNKFRNQFSNKLISTYKEGIKRSFEYL